MFYSREGKKTTLLRDFSEFPKVIEKQKEITEVEQKLNDLKPDIAKVYCFSCLMYLSIEDSCML